MGTMKKFFIYFLLIVAFYIFSKVAINGALSTTYAYKDVNVKTDISMDVAVEATNINGFAKGKILNDSGKKIEDSYIKIECYSKNNVLMGTKYIEIDELNTNEEKSFEIRFNFNKVHRAEISIVDEIDNSVDEKSLLSDRELGFIALIGTFVFLTVI